MAQRYSNINQGTELKLAQTNLENYRKNKQTKKTSANPTVGASRPKIETTLKSFDGEYTTIVQVSVGTASLTKLAGSLAGRIDSSAQAKANAIKLQGFRPARIHYFEPDGNNRSYVKSKATGLNYIKYPGKSYSCPFGARTANEEESIAAKLVKTDVLLIATSLEYRRVWYASERIKA